jgi:hypothetical protein
MKIKITLLLIFLVFIFICCAEVKSTFRQSKDAVNCKLECSNQYHDCRDGAGDNESALAACDEKYDNCIAACE